MWHGRREIALCAHVFCFFFKFSKRWLISVGFSFALFPVSFVKFLYTTRGTIFTVFPRLSFETKRAYGARSPSFASCISHLFCFCFSQIPFDNRMVISFRSIFFFSKLFLSSFVFFVFVFSFVLKICELAFVVYRLLIVDCWWVDDGRRFQITAASNLIGFDEWEWFR